MGITERKERERIERGEAIVDAAERIIFEKGFEEATMDDIAEEAELSKGALYLYFKNKMELYLAICQRGSDKLNAKFSRILALDHPGLELIRMMGEAYLEFVTRDPLYFRMFQYYEGIRDEEFLENSKFAGKCEENSREALTIMARALQIGMQDGSIDDSYDPKELAIIIWASSRGIVHLAHLKSRKPHDKLLEGVDLKMESMFEAFIGILGSGMASKKNE